MPPRVMTAEGEAAPDIVTGMYGTFPTARQQCGQNQAGR
jgi:hypothetical protein